MHDLKQLRDDANGILGPSFYVEARVGSQNYRGECVRALMNGASRNERADELLKRLAAFVRDVTDETPVDEEWLRAVSPVCKWNVQAINLSQTGECYCERYNPFNFETTRMAVGRNITRGRVRLLAMAMALELREETNRAAR